MMENFLVDLWPDTQNHDGNIAVAITVIDAPDRGLSQAIGDLPRAKFGVLLDAAG